LRFRTTIGSNNVYLCPQDRLYSCSGGSFEKGHSAKKVVMIRHRDGVGTIIKGTLN
tara:strand:- start:394 stop:561 length:168 start_codon:yes stop_codon:yes gene_type:complete